MCPGASREPRPTPLENSDFLNSIEKGTRYIKILHYQVRSIPATFSKLQYDQ